MKSLRGHKRVFFDIMYPGFILRVISCAHIQLKNSPLLLCLIVWQLKQMVLTRFNVHWKRD